MTVEELFESVISLQNRLVAKRDQQKMLEMSVMGGSIRYDKERVQTSLNGDKFGDILGTVVDMDKEISDLEKLLEERKALCMGYIRQINPLEGGVLASHYIYGLSYREIARRMGKSNTWVHSLKKSGLSAVSVLKEYGSGKAVG